MDLPKFVLARVDAAEAAADEWHHMDCSRMEPSPGPFPCDCDAQARVLAWCEALRAIVERCARVANERDDVPNGLVSPRAVLARQTLAAFAPIWAGHPDFDPSWR